MSKAILLDRDENSIFELQNELAEIVSPSQIVPIVGDIRDRHQLQRIFERHRPEVVLHAAAFKHVGMMEQNPCEAVLNNVMGTRHVAELAIEFKAKRFVMISTDKAVRPTSVMGATKRVAELLVRRLGFFDQRAYFADRMRALRKCGGKPRKCGTHISASDRRRRTGDDHARGDDTILHDHSGGRAIGDAGIHPRIKRNHLHSRLW